MFWNKQKKQETPNDRKCDPLAELETTDKQENELPTNFKEWLRGIREGTIPEPKVQVELNHVAEKLRDISWPAVPEPFFRELQEGGSPKVWPNDALPAKKKSEAETITPMEREWLSLCDDVTKPKLEEAKRENPETIPDTQPDESMAKSLAEAHRKLDRLLVDVAHMRRHQTKEITQLDRLLVEGRGRSKEITVMSVDRGAATGEQIAEALKRVDARREGCGGEVETKEADLDNAESTTAENDLRRYIAENDVEVLDRPKLEGATDISGLIRQARSIIYSGFFSYGDMRIVKNGLREWGFRIQCKPEIIPPEFLGFKCLVYFDKFFGTQYGFEGLVIIREIIPVGKDIEINCVGNGKPVFLRRKRSTEMPEVKSIQGFIGGVFPSIAGARAKTLPILLSDDQKNLIKCFLDPTLGTRQMELTHQYLLESYTANKRIRLNGKPLEREFSSGTWRVTKFEINSVEII